MPARKLRVKNNKIVKNQQLGSKKKAKRLIYLKNTTNFVICVVYKKLFT